MSVLKYRQWAGRVTRLIRELPALRDSETLAVPRVTTLEVAAWIERTTNADDADKFGWDWLRTMAGFVDVSGGLSRGPIRVKMVFGMEMWFINESAIRDPYQPQNKGMVRTLCLAVGYPIV